MILFYFIIITYGGFLKGIQALLYKTFKLM